MLITCVAAPTYDALLEPGQNVFRREDVTRTNNTNYNSNTINNIIGPGQKVYRTESRDTRQPVQQKTSYPNIYSTPITTPSQQVLTTTDDYIPEPGQQQMNNPNTVPEPGQIQMNSSSDDNVPEPGQTEMKSDDEDSN